MTKKKQDKIAIYPTISNPPTFGTVFILLKIAEIYDTVLVLVYDKAGILTTNRAVGLLGYVLSKLSDKFVVMSTSVDFAHVNELPTDDNGIALDAGKEIVTTSKTIYANLKGKGFNNILLIEPLHGYNESFHRIAYTRSLTLERLKQTCNIKR